MTKVTRFAEAEIAEPLDFEAISLHAREGDENIVGAAIGYPSHWAQFTVATPTATTIRITPGQYFVDKKIYDLDADLDIPLQVHLPILAGDTKWIAVLARGIEEVVNADRLVETDVETGDTVLVSAPKTDQRRVEFVLQQGIPGPTPVKPIPAAGDCCICFVLVNSVNIVSIESGQDWRVKTLYEVEGRLTVLEGRVDLTIERTAQLETTVANLASQIGNIPREELMRQLMRDTAAARRLLRLPDNARGYWYDPGLVPDDWDNGYAGWNARVREGIRFPYSQIVDNQLALMTPSDPKLTIFNSMAFPKYHERARITVDGDNGVKDISEQVHTVETLVSHTVSGTSINYGPSFGVCENKAEWANIGSRRPGAIFNVNGQQYISEGLAEGNLANEDGNIADFTAWNAAPTVTGHKGYAVKQVQYDTWSHTYWTRHVEEFGVNGSIYGQTFLNAQPMIATSIEVKFKRVATTGIVHLVLCEVSETGAPQFKNVIARSQLDPENDEIVAGWNKFKITPTLLTEGKRYAWYTVTVGNHSLVTVNDNKYAQGSLFWATDGIWAQGDNVTDFCFKINAAEFESTRTVVEFVGLNCPLGMSEIQLLFNALNPPGTSITWEIKPNGQTEWHSILNGDPAPLAPLPEQASLRATFVGTTDLAPGIKLDNTARAVAMRIASTMTAVTMEMDLGYSSDQITVQTVVDDFDPIDNAVINEIVVAGAVIEADSTSVEIDYDKPSRRIFTSLFMLAEPTTTIRTRPSMTTNDIRKAPFIQNIAHYAT